MSTRVTDADRNHFAAIADVLIPESESMPSASQVDVHGAGLDRVLQIRRDLQEPLLRGLRASLDGSPAQIVEALKNDDPAALAAIREVAKSAYYMDARVCELLGYPGQRSRPAAAEEEYDYMQDDMLQAVIDRGPIFRRDPDS